MKRIAVIGAGAFGRNHLRVVRESERAHLAAVFDIDPERTAAAAKEFGCEAAPTLESLFGQVDGAIVATPTTTHADVGCALLSAGIDVLVEKPVAQDLASAQRLIDAAGTDRILQVGHLERYNPAVLALRKIVTIPLFFEIHRMSVFTPRSLDVDVVLDLMIHDIDLVLDLTKQSPCEVRAAGISVLSKKVDIANVRLAFPNGCVTNLTSSRVSTEKVRKMRLFQPGQYVSIDYGRQDGIAVAVSPTQQISFQPLSTTKVEPLKTQLDTFLDAMETRTPPAAGGPQGLHALQVALDILDKIEEHTALVARSLETQSPASQ
ncbi:MAG: Gfo/Idh/MocA family oxidoreductase [Acidobacteria bacterium]|nr:Gfo/Idh/MocA family oxidoreductase [Acidobacteriota bacterium]